MIYTFKINVKMFWMLHLDLEGIRLLFITMLGLS